MPVLLWYFMRRVGGVIGGLWLALTALVVALEMLADLGGDPFAESLLLALLQGPRLALETLPFACAIGAAFFLQRMTETGELQAMRSAGLSLARTAALTAAGGALFSAAALAVGETLLEPGESLTRALKNAPTARGNVWLHRGGVFFHARSLDENGAMRDVSVYQMADGGLKIITAASARLQDGSWRLADGEESHLSAEGVRRELFAEQTRDWPLSVSALQALTRRPQAMSMRMLAQAAENDAPRYASALWRRAMAALALPLLAACAVCCIGGAHRRAAAAVLMSVALVGGYYFAAAICSQLSLLLRIPALAALPLILLFAVLFAGVQRKFA